MNIKVRGTCTIKNCERPHAARGWCFLHYKRWKQFGNPEQYSIYDKNQYTVDGDTVVIALKDKQGTFVANTLIELNDLNLVAKYKWVLGKRGYVVGTVAGKTTPLHRLIMDFPDSSIDHINRDRLDNRRSNLRVCTSSQNSQNMMPRTGTTSKYRGVHFDGRKWSVSCTFPNCDKKYWGAFYDEVEAAHVYNQIVQQLGDEHHYLNDLDDIAG